MSLIFRKKKYYFNTATLTFEEVRIKKSHKIMVLSGSMLLIVIITFISGYFLNRYLGSTESRMLEREVNVLTEEMKGQLNKGLEIGETLRNDLFVQDNNYRIILQMDTLDIAVRSAGTGGSAIAGQLARQNDISYQVNSVINSLTNQLQVQSGSFRKLYDKAMQYSEGQTHFPAIQPVDKKDLIMIGSFFGERSDPFIMITRNHYGLDFVAHEGTPVYATGDGIVTFVQYSRTGYGNEIMLDLKFGFGTRYAHLQTVKVREGETIKRGQMIGTVGATGRATGPHLHYEVLFQHRPVNPSFYFDTTLTREEFAQIINKARTGDNLN
jgi:murein DD-endopeptidase MepM/ murein hydrolase activator NlpD